MQKKQIIIVIVVLVAIIAAVIGFILYKRKNAAKKAQQGQKSVESTPAVKPYDGEFKKLADAFFTTSKLGPEQEAALYEDMQKRFMVEGAGKVDAFVAAVSNWLPAWLSDENLQDKKADIEAAWATLYKEWSTLKAKAFKN